MQEFLETKLDSERSRCRDEHGIFLLSSRAGRSSRNSGNGK